MREGSFWGGCNFKLLSKKESKNGDESEFGGGGVGGGGVRGVGWQIKIWNLTMKKEGHVGPPFKYRGMFMERPIFLGYITNMPLSLNYLPKR